MTEKFFLNQNETFLLEELDRFIDEAVDTLRSLIDGSVVATKGRAQLTVVGATSMMYRSTFTSQLKPRRPTVGRPTISMGTRSSVGAV